MSRKPMNPDSDNARVLRILIEVRWNACGGIADGWVDHPYQRLRVMWHSRIAELRRRGWVIESRRVMDAAGKADYQYRLVSMPHQPEGQA
jgi:hypothetical protein